MLAVVGKRRAFLVNDQGRCNRVPLRSDYLGSRPITAGRPLKAGSDTNQKYSSISLATDGVRHASPDLLISLACPSANMRKLLVTGAAGFIGYHVCETLLKRGDEVVGVDNLSSYYDVKLKESRLACLTRWPEFTFHRLDLADAKATAALFEQATFPLVIHLAAQAGVRYSLENPHAYVDSNLTGFVNVLEGCRRQRAAHLVYASSSSVYGANRKVPYSVHDATDHPVSLYAATKKANELMAHAYSHLYNLPTTGLRFFTVYGPWGRPDMVVFLFTRAILEGRPIDVFNFGEMQRDFTYIEDVAEAVARVADHVPQGSENWRADCPDPAASKAPYRIFNIGNNQPLALLRLIEIIEDAVGKKAEKNLLPMQAGDVPATHADVDDLMREIGFRPDTPLEVGVEKFVAWYRSYYGV